VVGRNGRLVVEKQIGQAAGKVWQALNKAPTAAAQLPKVTGLSAEATNQAIGWLAREGKLTAQSTARGFVLKLKS